MPSCMIREERQYGGGFGRRCRKRSSYMLVSWSPQKTEASIFAASIPQSTPSGNMHAYDVTDRHLIGKISSASTAAGLSDRSQRTQYAWAVPATGGRLNHSSQFMGEDGQYPDKDDRLLRTCVRALSLAEIVKETGMEILKVRIILMIAEWPFQ